MKAHTNIFTIITMYFYAEYLMKLLKIDLLQKQ